MAPEQHQALGADLMRGQLERVLGSETFSRSDRHRRFLSFLVDRVLAGRSQDLTENRVATEVFRRKEPFDPTVDPIVRVEAGRLRKRLQDYADNEGAGDPVVLELPPRTYTPACRSREVEMKAPRQHAPAHWRRIALTTVAPLLAIAAVVGSAVILSGSSQKRERERINTAQAAATPAVVVLPVLDLSMSQTEDALCDTLTEELIDELANTAGWRVVSRTSSFQYKGKPADVRQIGKELNAQLVLEASLRRYGDRLRIAVNLVSAQDGYNIWSRTYEKKVSEIGSFEHDLAVDAAKQMGHQVWQGR